MGERDVLGSSPRDSGSLCSQSLDRQLYEAALAGRRNSLTLGRYVQIKDLEWATGQLPVKRAEADMQNAGFQSPAIVAGRDDSGGQSGRGGQTLHVQVNP